ncbi:MAG TPA: hypothetical protein VHF67_08450 [Gaiellaceae bacterium]|nr:hypothetical protein [Gaiellaceae bacterium]
MTHPSGEDEHEVEVAEQEAAAALPAGWELEPLESERFRLPGGSVQTYAAAAHGPDEEAALVVALRKADAYRELVRRLEGELEIAEGWAPPVPPLPPESVESGFVGPYEEEPEVIEALDELTRALPEGWQLYEVDRERYRLPGRKLETFGVSAVGPGGEAALVVAVGEAGAYRQLTRRLRGELEVTDAWAPPL